MDCSGGGFNRFEKCIVNLEFSDSIYHTIECGLVWQSYDTTSLIIKKKIVNWVAKLWTLRIQFHSSIFA